MTSSESPTHPDAPRAGGETPTPRYEPTYADATRALETFRSLSNAGDTDAMLMALDEYERKRAWALRASLLARHRDGERETVCGMRFVVDRTIPPGEIHMRQDGRVVARLINVTDGEVAVGSAPPSPERASK